MIVHSTTFTIEQFCADPTARNLMPELGLGGDEPGQLCERARTCAVVFVIRTL